MSDSLPDPDVSLPSLRAPGDPGSARRAEWAALLTTLAGVGARDAGRPRDGVPSIVNLLPSSLHPAVHTALLGWLCDPRGEHHLGLRGLQLVLGLAGRDVALADGPLAARQDGEVLWLEGPTSRLGLTVRPVDDGGDDPGAGDDPAVIALEAEALGRSLAGLAESVAPDARGLVLGWTASLRREKLPGETMGEFQTFGPHARFVLDHWHEFQAMAAARERLDEEFAAMRRWVFGQVQARWGPEDGWVCLLEEDWILLRRAAWPIPAEEWLALVVVIPDVGSVLLGDPGEGWFGGLALPTDGDFHDEAFAALLRARLDPGVWRAHLARRRPGYALCRPLGPAPPGEELSAFVARVALDELGALTALVPDIDAVLGSLR